jgi:ABC-type polysaccharide/polyol phosphate transport system ATPase subunit
MFRSWPALRSRSAAEIASPASTLNPVTTALGQGSPSSATGGDARPPAISIGRVTKTFRLPRENVHTLKERALRPLASRTVDVLTAVNDVSLEIHAGEFFGIVGRNGSGKSTLLKCLAGIYDIDDGRMEINGRLSPFIELGVGFNPELTARDNVFVNAIMLGLSRKQVEQRYDAIVTFAELEEFMELKLKNYSSGMQVRLAFAVAIQVDADILLIDEVLAVGDASFQQKCFGEFDRLKSSGKTIVFVTHDMGAVERFCDRALLLERGRVVEIAEPQTIARHYNELNFRRMRREAQEFGGPQTLKEAPVAELTRARFEDGNGEQQFEAMQRDPCWVRLDVYFHAEAVDPIFAIALIDDRGGTAFAASTQITYGPTGRFRAGTTAVVRIRFENWLTPGRYRLTASVARDEVRPEAYDARLEISSLIVHGRRPGGGMVDLPHTFEIS